jgi:peptide/nickel transport system permease protein
MSSATKSGSRMIQFGHWPMNLVIGGTIVAGMFTVAIVSLFWTPEGTAGISVSDRLAPVGSPGAPLGRDGLGRDIVSLIMAGARSSLIVGFGGSMAGIIFGLLLGGLALVHRRLVDEVIMRWADIMYALPAILLAMILATTLGPGIGSAILAIGVGFTPVVARIVRGAGLQIANREFVAAARGYGRSDTYIILRHVLPNISHVIIVQATVMFATAILLEAALSYLGIGVQPPIPSWGRMLRDAQSFVSAAPTTALFPGLVIILSVLGFNLLGDGLRDVLDPRHRRGRQ